MKTNKVDKEIIKKGVAGELSIDEIERLPEEYKYYKETFKSQTTLKKNKRGIGHWADIIGIRTDLIDGMNKEK